MSSSAGHYKFTYLASLEVYLQRAYTSGRSELHFQWDDGKATINERKHGITFEEARTVLFDERARVIDDPDHSDDEERSILLGMSSHLRLLIVVHCYRAAGNSIRIISARKATIGEEKSYR